MVKIVDYEKRINQDNLKEFFVLILQGELEIMQSKQSGNFYATARKVSISTTFNEEGCKALMGQEIQGCIEKVSCEPYNYTVEETGEIVSLDYRYVFNPNVLVNTQASSETSLTGDLETFSENGVLEHAN